VRYDLRNELERLARDEERHAISPLGRALLGLINIGNLVAEVARSRDLEVLAKESFENQSGHSSHEVSDAVAAFRHEMAGEDDKVRSVTDADLVALIVLSAMIASGFDRLDAPAQLYQIRRNTAAFIDEVQDFREIEVMLMGMVVTDTYHQITLAGDRRQQLQAMGTDDLRNLFPFVPRSLRNQTVFLDRNFRQRKDLRVLSEGIRSVLQEGAIVQRERDSSTATVHTFRSHSGMVQFIVSRLLTVDPYATAAFIMPSESEARRWYELLREELAAYHRPALLSHRDDLTRRNDIHFTEAREAKGLEFDVVVVPDVSAFDLESDIGKNQLYVAISRPRHALLLGCEHQSASGASLQKLEEAKIVSMVPIQEPSVH
jgi:DNA helicase IV